MGEIKKEAASDIEKSIMKDTTFESVAVNGWTQLVTELEAGPISADEKSKQHPDQPQKRQRLILGL